MQISCDNKNHQLKLREDTSIFLKQDQMLTLVLTKNTMASEVVTGSVTKVCDYMSCHGCNRLGLQKICYAAQKCAVTNCVGTVINVNNFLCVIGGTIKEYTEISSSNLFTVWHAIVEIIMGILKVSLVENNNEVMHFEFVSNIFVSLNCETKDTLAMLSAWIPSLVSTIYTAISANKGNEALLDINTGSTNIVQQKISPLKQLRDTTRVIASIEFIYNILLGFIHFGSTHGKILLCLTNNLMAESGGYVRFIDNRVGENILNYCDSNKLDDDDSSNQQDDEKLIMSMVRQNAHGSYTSRLTIQQYPRADVQFGVGSVLSWAIDVKRMTMLLEFTAIYDWILGIMHGVSGIAMLLEPEECRPLPVQLASVLDCVCGDKGVRIASDRRKESIGNFAFWCSGVLKMVNSDGYEKYVYNKWSFEELVTDLHEKGYNYLQNCVSQRTLSSEQCAVLLSKIEDPRKYANFLNNKVSPLAVLTRCRENFAAKTWDVGIFAAGNEDIKNDVLSVYTIEEKEIEFIFSSLKDIPSVLQCLAMGPLRTTVQSCMNVYLTTYTLSSMNYFYYTDIENGEIIDACKFLSDPDFSKYPDVNKCIQHNENTACIKDSILTGTDCNIMMTTLSADQMSRTDVVQLFNIKAKFNETEASSWITDEYEKIKICIDGLMTGFTKKIDSIITKINIEIATSEGDVIHQMLDCIFMGAYNYTIMMPADTLGLLENVMYSRHSNGESRELPLPCKGGNIYDTTKGGILYGHQRTCGSPGRISGISYVLHMLRNDEKVGMGELMKTLISKKLDEMRNQLQVRNFGCSSKDQSNKDSSWKYCCAVPGNCPPGSIFTPQVELNTMISSGEILQEIILPALKTVQNLALIDKTVFVHMYFCFLMFTISISHVKLKVFIITYTPIVYYKLGHCLLHHFLSHMKLEVVSFLRHLYFYRLRNITIRV
jgi:hypothetical protein